MLMPAAGTTGVAAQSWETALALRGMALLQPDLPKYLLAPEVAVLLSCFYDERQRMLGAVERGVEPGTASGVALTPQAEFTPPAGTRPLAPRTRWSPGAFQD